MRAYFLQTLPLLLIFPFLFSFCHVAAQVHESTASGRWKDNMLPWRRFMVEEALAANYFPANLSTENHPFILAAERTRRVDPQNGSNYYTGGWNLKDEHYLSSVAFTAAPLISISLAWFFGFGFALLLACCFSCFCRRRQQRRSNSFSHSWHSFSFIMLILLACAAIIGCIVFYAGHGKSHNIAMTTIDYMKGQSDFIAENFQNLASKMAGAEKTEVDKVFLSTDLQAKIEEISMKISMSSFQLSSQASESYRVLREILKITQLYLIITAAALLLLTFLGLAFSMLGLQFPVYFLVLLGWIFVSVTFLACSLFLIIHNMVGDTCVAMNEWVANPQENTVLSEIIPCVDAATASESLSRSKEVTFHMVQVVNNVIINASNLNFSPRSAVPPPINFNQSGPLVPILCNPYDPDLRDRTCRKGEVSFDNASEVWLKFICNSKVVSGNDICTSTGRLTPGSYTDMASATSMSQALYLYIPFLMKVGDCTFARETVSTIFKNYCPGIEHNSKLLYVGLTIETAATMLSLIFWMVLVVQRRELKNGKNSTTQEGPHIAGYKL